MDGTGLFHGFAQRAVQALVAGKTQHIAHLVGFTPGHDRFAAEPGVAANHDPRLRPTPTDLADTSVTVRVLTVMRVDEY
jgi:hypothetical protein